MDPHQICGTLAANTAAARARAGGIRLSMVLEHPQILAASGYDKPYVTRIRALRIAKGSVSMATRTSAWSAESASPIPTRHEAWAGFRQSSDHTPVALTEYTLRPRVHSQRRCIYQARIMLPGPEKMLARSCRHLHSLAQVCRTTLVFGGCGDIGRPVPTHPADREPGH